MKIFIQSLKGKYIVSFIIAIIVYQVTYGFATLDPTNINWLMSVYHDWGTHYLGWAFYRNDPWGYPLGNTQSYFYPIGTNVGFTDTIPLLAFIFKIFSGILPEDFQFYGIWLLLCYFLTAFYSIKIFNLYKTNSILIILAVIIITSNPVLVFRGIHPSLCAHWLLLASLYNYLQKSTSENVLRINRNQVLLFFLSATINPYLALMLAGFNVIIPFRHYFYDNTLSLKKAIIFPLVSFLIGLVFWIVFGLLVFSNNTNLDVGNIYGLYAFNLNSFFNSFGYYSKFIPHLGMVTDQQHEGFGYLGMGMIIIVGIAFVYLLFRTFTNKAYFNGKRILLPLFALCFFLFLFSVSNKVSWGTEVLFTYKALPIIEKIGNIFRATGRFIWIVYYVIIIFSLVLFFKIKANKATKIIVMVLLTGLQLYDIENLLTSRDLKSGEFHTKLDDAQWIKIFKNFDEIITYPPFTNNLVYAMDYQDLSFLALKSKKPITNGYVARENLTESQAYKDTLSATIRRGEINENQIFITTPKYLDEFKVLFYKDNVQVKRLNNFIFIFSKAKTIQNLFKESDEDTKFIDSVYHFYNSKSKYKILEKKLSETNNLQFNIEVYSYDSDIMNISGWAFNKNNNTTNPDSIFLSLSNKTKTFLIPAKLIKREDIAQVYKNKNLTNPGFSATIFTDKIPKENYELGIAIRDNKGVYNYVKSDKLTSVGKIKPKPISTLPPISPIISNLELVSENPRFIKLSGWAALPKKDSKQNKIEIVLISNSHKFSFETDLVLRNDVTVVNLNKFNYDNSGFSLKINRKDLPKGKYEIGVIINDNVSNKSYLKKFGKLIKN